MEGVRATKDVAFLFVADCRRQVASPTQDNNNLKICAPHLCRGGVSPPACLSRMADCPGGQSLRVCDNLKIGAPHLCRGRRPRRPALAICNLSRIHLIHRYAVPLPPLGKAKLCDDFKIGALSFASLVQREGDRKAVEGLFIANCGCPRLVASASSLLRKHCGGTKAPPYGIA